MCGDESMIYCKTFGSLHKNEIRNVQIWIITYAKHSFQCVKFMKEHFILLRIIKERNVWMQFFEDSRLMDIKAFFIKAYTYQNFLILYSLRAF